MTWRQMTSPVSASLSSNSCSVSAPLPFLCTPSSRLRSASRAPPGGSGRRISIVRSAATPTFVPGSAGIRACPAAAGRGALPSIAALEAHAVRRPEASITDSYGQGQRREVQGSQNAPV